MNRQREKLNTFSTDNEESSLHIFIQYRIRIDRTNTASNVEAASVAVENNCIFHTKHDRIDSGKREKFGFVEKFREKDAHRSSSTQTHTQTFVLYPFTLNVSFQFGFGHIASSKRCLVIKSSPRTGIAWIFCGDSIFFSCFRHQMDWGELKLKKLFVKQVWWVCMNTEREKLFSLP